MQYICKKYWAQNSPLLNLEEDIIFVLITVIHDHLVTFVGRLKSNIKAFQLRNGIDLLKYAYLLKDSDNRKRSELIPLQCQKIKYNVRETKSYSIS